MNARAGGAGVERREAMPVHATAAWTSAGRNACPLLARLLGGRSRGVSAATGVTAATEITVALGPSPHRPAGMCTVDGVPGIFRARTGSIALSVRRSRADAFTALAVPLAAAIVRSGLTPRTAPRNVRKQGPELCRRTSTILHGSRRACEDESRMTKREPSPRALKVLSRMRRRSAFGLGRGCFSRKRRTRFRPVANGTRGGFAGPGVRRVPAPTFETPPPEQHATDVASGSQRRSSVPQQQPPRVVGHGLVDEGHVLGEGHVLDQGDGREALHGGIRTNRDACAYRMPRIGFANKLGQDQKTHHRPGDSTGHVHGHGHAHGHAG